MGHELPVISTLSHTRGGSNVLASVIESPWLGSSVDEAREFASSSRFLSVDLTDCSEPCIETRPAIAMAARRTLVGCPGA
jgi:hypothetical protein